MAHTDLEKITKLNEMICDVDFIEDNDVNLCEFIEKLSSYDWNTSFGLLTRYFIHWYEANPRKNQMGEDEFLEAWLNRCLAKSRLSKPGDNDEIDNKVCKILEQLNNTTDSYRSAIKKIMNWTDEEEDYNIKKYMPLHWYKAIKSDDIESFFDGETELLTKLFTKKYVPLTLSRKQIDSLYDFIK